MKTAPITSIPGALAREDGMIKLPDTHAEMPHGGVREYKSKWKHGVKTRASKTARHEYYGFVHRGRNYKVHRLICEAFHGPAPDGMDVVIHLNEDALDNRPENLKWGTQKENLNAAGFIAYCRSRTGENSPRFKGKTKKENRA